MLRLHSFRLNLNMPVTRHVPASIAKCRHRQIASHAGERRRGPLRRSEQPNTSDGHTAATQDYPSVIIRYKNTGQPTYRVGSFDFDPFPPLLFPAQPQYSRAAEAEIIDARRRDLKQGRLLISRIGSAESALTALRAAYSGLQLHMQRRAETLSSARWKTISLNQSWENRSHVPGCRISFARQAIAITEAALEHKTGIELAHASFAVESRSTWLSQLELMYPFELQLKVQGVLYRFIRSVCIETIGEFGKIGMRLHNEQKILVDSFAHSRASDLKNSDPFRQRYELIKRCAYDLLLNLGATNATLYMQCIELINLTTVKIRSWSLKDRSFLKALQTYKDALVSATKFISDLEADMFTIQLRRRSLRDGAQQHIYSALHHHFKRKRASSQHFYRQTRRQYVGLAMQAVTFYRKKGSGEAESALLRYEHAFCKTLDKVEAGMREIMRIYHEEFLILWASSIRLKSSSELVRQDRIAQKYWLYYFRSDKKHESRIAELGGILRPISIARHVSNSDSKPWFGGQTVDKRALAAIAQLSELYRTRYQGAAKPHTQIHHELAPENRATSSVMPDARKLVLWQPHHHPIDNGAPDVSAILRSRERASPLELNSENNRRSNTELVPFSGVQASALLPFLGKDEMSMPEATDAAPRLQAPRARLDQKTRSLSDHRTVARKTRHTLRQTHPPIKPPFARDRQDKHRPKKDNKRVPHVKASMRESRSGKPMTQKDKWSQDKERGLRGLNTYPLGPF